MNDMLRSNPTALVELGLNDVLEEPFVAISNKASQLTNNQYRYNELKSKEARDLNEAEQSFIKQHEVEMKKFFEVYDKYTSLK